MMKRTLKTAAIVSAETVKGQPFEGMFYQSAMKDRAVIVVVKIYLQAGKAIPERVQPGKKSGAGINCPIDTGRGVKK